MSSASEWEGIRFERFTSKAESRSRTQKPCGEVEMSFLGLFGALMESDTTLGKT